MTESGSRELDEEKWIVITPENRVGIFNYLREVWSYRDMVRAFVIRDIKVRYKQTVLGVSWVLIQPLLTAGIFSVLFGAVMNIESEGMPPMLFYLSGLIPLTCFTNALSQASSCLESNVGLIRKVYFPRLIIPIASVTSTIVDFCVGWLTFNLVALGLGYAAILHAPETEVVTRVYWTWLFIPFTLILLLLQQMTAIGIGLIFSVLGAQFRDIRYVVPFILQLFMYFSPVIYPIKRLLATRFGESAMIIIYLNPMAGVIETYRALLMGDYLPYKILATNFAVAVTLLFIGIWFFRKREPRVVDLL